MNIDKSYSIGYQAGLAALETCSESNASEKDALAGLLSVVMHAAYSMAPTEEIAEEIITWAQKTALEDWIIEKGE